MSTLPSRPRITGETDVPEGKGPSLGSQRDLAYARLRRLLLLHRAPAGKRLQEERWAERLGVNRTALREAFARLEAEGLIERGPIPGYFVPRLTREDVLEIIEVRIMLEGGAIDRICRFGLNTLDNLRGMIASCERFDGLATGDDYPAIADADRSFHEALIRAAENDHLTTLYQRAPLPIIPPDFVSGEEWAERVQRTLDEHRRLLDGLLRGDAVEAKAILRTHLAERYLIPICAV